MRLIYEINLYFFPMIMCVLQVDDALLRRIACHNVILFIISPQIWQYVFDPIMRLNQSHKKTHGRCNIMPETLGYPLSNVHLNDTHIRVPLASHFAGR